MTLPTPYYDEDGITIYHGDAREVLPSLPPVDLLITSPPYNLDGNSCGYGGAKYVNPDYLTESLLDAICDAHARYKWLNIQVLSANKVIFLQWLGKRANCVKDIMVWVKPNPQPAMATGLLNSGFELLLCLSDYEPYKRPFPDVAWRGTVNNVQYFPSASSSNGEARVHHATFPPQLPLFLLETFGGKSVLDPCCGTGTTLRVAKDAGCTAIGIEIEEKYVEIAIRRLQQEVLPLGEEKRNGQDSDMSRLCRPDVQRMQVLQSMQTEGDAQFPLWEKDQH